MSARIFVVGLVLMGACATPRRSYVAVDVRSAELPVEDATVVISCAAPRGYALRTDRAGRARILVGTGVVLATCTLLAAKHGYATVQASGAGSCDDPNACHPTILQIGASR